MAKEKLGVDVVAIVTDNASNMECARKNLENVDVFTYGCQAHGAFGIIVVMK